MDAAYSSQFLTIVVVHLLAVASPGPDFAIVVKHSVSHGKGTAVWTSLGVGTGILVHVLYSLLGIGMVISQSLTAFTVMKCLGAGYLFYIGWKALASRPAAAMAAGRAAPPAAPTAARAYWTGFLTNGFNPKATLFFLSLFTAIIDPGTPLRTQAFYGLYMAAATALWFCGISLLFGSDAVRALFGRIGHWFERLMGGALMLLGLKLVMTTQR